MIDQVRKIALGAGIYFSLVVLALPVLAQVQTAQGQGSDAGRMMLDVVAVDSSGAPVAGLTQQDFTVADNKLPQKIVSFQAVSGATAAEGDTLSIVLVVDSINASFTTVTFARDQIRTFLQQDAQKLAWPMALAFLSDTGFQLQEARAGDSKTLLAALTDNKQALRETRRSQGYYGAAERTTSSLRALAQLGVYEEKRPGRKMVLWISPGWPMLSGPNVRMSSKDEDATFGQIVGISQAVRRARMTLYSLDPLGTADEGARTMYYKSFLHPVKAPKQAEYGALALQVLATQTGGRVLNASNDVTAEVEKCLRDASAYYVIGYDAPAVDTVHEYHAIEVKIGRPNVKAQTRTGYYAEPERARVPAAP